MSFDGPDGTGSSFTDINDRGQIVGIYVDDPRTPVTLRGFLLRNGVYTTFEAPGVPFTVPKASTIAARSQAYRAVDLAQMTPRIPAAKGRQRPLHPDRLPGRA